MFQPLLQCSIFLEHVAHLQLLQKDKEMFLVTTKGSTRTNGAVPVFSSVSWQSRDSTPMEWSPPLEAFKLNLDGQHSEISRPLKISSQTTLRNFLPNPSLWNYSSGSSLIVTSYPPWEFQTEMWKREGRVGWGIARNTVSVLTLVSSLFDTEKCFPLLSTSQESLIVSYSP